MGKDFRGLQYQLAAHLRNPRDNPPPEGLESRRLDVYRRLFFNNVSGFISNSFPVLKEFYNDDDWRALIRKFYARHESHSPYFADVSKEFLAYLENEHEACEADPPFITELAHYEWVELALSLAQEEVDSEAIDPDGDPLRAPPALSPLAWRLTYRWPVHRIGPDFHPEKPGDEPTLLAACRDHKDKIRFMILNRMTDLLLDEIVQNPRRAGHEHVEEVIRRLRVRGTDAARASGAETLSRMREKDVILGTWKTPPEPVPRLVTKTAPRPVPSGYGLKN